jgi:hypothetical protein
MQWAKISRIAWLLPEIAIVIPMRMVSAARARTTSMQIIDT